MKIDIEKLRREAGITQQELAEKAGLNRITVLRAEKGKVQSLSIYKKLLSVFNYELIIRKK